MSIGHGRLLDSVFSIVQANAHPLARHTGAVSATGVPPSVPHVKEHELPVGTGVEQLKAASLAPPVMVKPLLSGVTGHPAGSRAPGSHIMRVMQVHWS